MTDSSIADHTLVCSINKVKDGCGMLFYSIPQPSFSLVNQALLLKHELGSRLNAQLD
ncbi:hypothetical protein HMPREF1978_00454 [Actinomyces graevenitzii F0530]|uniref:Uncharacterized protein n=1 Tax=Actinomyces graevenitzii F0530 TaxID=1321817 RepID=U1Q618_9ACTO|nr:hypothetical protein HMPREF1978_00454 [Actinomyces graevenitzii F0530]